MRSAAREGERGQLANAKVIEEDLHVRYYVREAAPRLHGRAPEARPVGSDQPYARLQVAGEPASFQPTIVAAVQVEDRSPDG